MNPRRQTVAVLGPLSLILAIVLGLIAEDALATGLALAGMGWSWILTALRYNRLPVTEPPGFLGDQERKILSAANVVTVVAVAVAFGLLVAGSSNILPYLACSV